MLKREIEYEDFNGQKRKETFYFNLTKAEVTEMEMTMAKKGRLSTFIESVAATNNERELIKLFKEFVLKCYGEKSDDGRRFIKTQELRDEFVQTQAYSDLYMELASNAEAASAFVNGVMPKEATLPQQR